MKFLKDAPSAFVAAGAIVMFLIGVVAASCAIAPPQARSPAAPVVAKKGDQPPLIVISYARKHPDPAVSGAFADKLASGEIKIVLAKPTEHAMASFGKRPAGFVLTVDPERLKPEPTLAEYEDVLAILSHEHAHYRQHVEDEMANYYPRGGPMTEGQCTLTITVEIGAHGKTCRDARAYGWTSPAAKDACRKTTASIAEYFLRERVRTYPECAPVWEFFAGKDVDKKTSRKKTRTRAPRPVATGTGQPIYMPPP
jgi:hypothetical protein